MVLRLRETRRKENRMEAISNKEDKNMKTRGTQVQVIDFEFNGVRYTNTRPNYYYKKVDGKQVRIPKAEYDEAWNASGEAEKRAREEKQVEADKQAEKTFKKASKPRRSKDIAFEQVGMPTLTAKQVKFIKRMPEDDFYEHGLDSALWIDVYCDTIADEFNPMSVGAMVSTLREKGLVNVGSDRVNGKRCKFMVFTDLGKQIAKELGLN